MECNIVRGVRVGATEIGKAEEFNVAQFCPRKKCLERFRPWDLIDLVKGGEHLAEPDDDFDVPSDVMEWT